MEFCGQCWVHNLLSNEADEYPIFFGMQEIREKDVEQKI